MKRLSWLPWFLLCALLLCFSDTAIAAAQSAVTLWLKRVLPALFPFYVATALLASGGLFAWIARRGRRLLPPACFLLGAISGYPVGARLCALAGHSEWSVYCNLCSPAFLLGVVAIGMLGDVRLAVPLMLAHYGAALAAALASRLAPSCERGQTPQETAPPPTIAQAIADGMYAMLRIGGCVIFFSVCAALIERALGLSDGLLSAGISGLMEMTAGCQAISVLLLPARLKCACLSAVVSLGGWSVFMQTRGTDPQIRAAAYWAGKAFQAGAAFLIAYAVTPYFHEESIGVLSIDADSMLDNAAALASLLLAGSTGMIFAYLFALIAKKARSHTGAGR